MAEVSTSAWAMPPVMHAVRVPARSAIQVELPFTLPECIGCSIGGDGGGGELESVHGDAAQSDDDDRPLVEVSFDLCAHLLVSAASDLQVRLPVRMQELAHALHARHECMPHVEPKPCGECARRIRRNVAEDGFRKFGGIFSVEHPTNEETNDTREKTFKLKETNGLERGLALGIAH